MDWSESDPTALGGWKLGSSRRLSIFSMMLFITGLTASWSSAFNSSDSVLGVKHSIDGEDTPELTIDCPQAALPVCSSSSTRCCHY